MISFKKRNHFYIFLFILIIAINLFFIYSLSQQKLKNSLGQNFEIIFKQPIFFNSDNVYVEILPALYNTAKNFFFINQKNTDVIEFDVKFKNILKIKNDRSNALENSFLSNPSKVSANISFNGKKYKAQIQLKGDTHQHWYLDKQWSFKIRLLEGKTILGMKSFSITRHRSRLYPLNSIISKILSSEKIYSPNYGHLNVTFNGQDWGLMLYEEQYSDAYIEIRKNSYGPIFKFGSEDYWVSQKKLLDLNISGQEVDFITRWQNKFSLNFYNSKDFKDTISLKRKTYIRNIFEKLLLDKINIDTLENYFDFNSFSLSLINSFILGEMHSLEFSNSRFYLNPYSMKLELIPTDHGPIKKLNQNDTLPHNLSDNKFRYLIYKNLVKSKSFQRTYIENLDKFSNFYLDFDKHLDFFCKGFFYGCKNQFRNISLNNNFLILKLKGLDQLHFFSNNFKNNFDINIDKKLNQNIKSKIVNINEILNEHIYARAFSDGNLRIYNTTPFKVRIKELIIFKDNCNNNCDIHFLINKDIESIKEDLINFNNFNFSELNSSFDFNNLNFEIITSVNGFDKSFFGLIEHSNHILNRNINNDLAYYDNQIITNAQKNNLNEIFIYKPIILKNRSLIIDKGITLRFAPDTFIYIENGNLILLGEEENQIKLLPLNTKWKGIYINNLINEKKNRSIIQNTIIQGTDSFNYNIFNLSGGVNFYNTNIDIENLIYLGSFAEDQINFIQSNFTINKSLFTDATSDSIDSDFSNGTILETVFKRTGGDSIDTSSSSLEIKDIDIYNSFDKGISAGESSNLKIENVNIYKSGVGIAIKDSSKLEGKNIFINGSFTTDLLSINKKSFFGPSNTIISNDNKNIDYSYIIQNGNSISVNNLLLPTTNVNVKDLYNSVRMK